MVALNSKGEVVDVSEADQFRPGKSQFECGYFACAIARTMSRPGQPPTMSAAQVVTNAEEWYAQFDGNNSASNTDGMTNEQEYELLHQVGLHYQAIVTNINQVKAWVSAGYPVLIAVTEASVRDLGLGGATPYPWNPSGNHIILVTGVTGGGNVLVRDSANVTDLNNPATLRPGPRTYSAAALQLVSATVVVPPWRPRTAGTTPPAADLQIPDGWSDDGQTLSAPNGVPVALGFRSYVLSHRWDAGDLPLAPESGADPVELGYKQADSKGSRQIFLYSELCYTPSRGVYRASVGREFYTLLQQAALTTTPSAPAQP